MRPLEVVMLAALVPVVAGMFFAPNRRPTWWLPLAAVPVLAGLAHVIIEGQRWQMVPAYVLAAVMLGIAIARRRSATDKPRSRVGTVLRLTGATLGALVLIVAALLPAVFPVFRLPQPTGRHAVGFTRFVLLDTARAELFSPDPTDRREVLVEAWYPTDAPGGDRATFWGPRIAYAYESIAVAHPDDRVVSVNQTRMDSIGKAMGASARALRSFAASTDRTERTTLFRKAIAEPLLLHESLRVWTEDTRFVMDELQRMNAGDGRGAPSGAVFTGKLDLSRIWVFGMSFGGTTAGQVCVVEPRCRAGVNLDGTQYGDPIDVQLRVPFMFMTSAISGLNDPVLSGYPEVRLSSRVP